MNNLFVDLYAKYAQDLSGNEKDVLKLLADQADTIPKSTINELANRIYISTSSLYRLIKKLGFQGYSDFKFRVTDSLQTNTIINDSTEKYLENTLNEIKYTHKINQQNLIKAAKLLLDHKDRYVYGTGFKQKQLVDNFASDMMLYGLNFFNVRTLDDLEVAIKNMSSDSVLVFVSLKGIRQDYNKIFDTLELRNIPIISITLDTANPLSMRSEIALYYADQDIASELTHWRSISLLYLLNLLTQAILLEKETK